MTTPPIVLPAPVAGPRVVPLSSFQTVEPPRQIVQVAASPIELFALCQDGTLWVMHLPAASSDKGWRRVSDVPQDD